MKYELTHPSRTPASSITKRPSVPSIDRRDEHTVRPMPRAVQDVLSSPGHALSETARARFEPALGHDLSNVRIHSDQRAETSARSVSARAYTVGNHVVLGRAGGSRPDMDQDQVLAHELTHVVQQRSGPRSN